MHGLPGPYVRTNLQSVSHCYMRYDNGRLFFLHFRSPWFVYTFSIGKVWLTLNSAECIYKKKWAPRPISSSKAPQANGLSGNQSQPKALSAEDDAKLIFGTIFSLRNMVRKLGGPEDKYVNRCRFAIGTRPFEMLILYEALYHTEPAITSYITTRLQRRSNLSWSQTRRRII